MPNTQYYFCEAPGCVAVYFPLDTQAPLYRRKDSVVRVGVKEIEDPLLLCYFGSPAETFGMKFVARGNQPWRSGLAEVEAGALSDASLVHFNSLFVWPFVLIGDGIAFLLEWRYTRFSAS